MGFVFQHPVGGTIEADPSPKPTTLRCCSRRMGPARESANTPHPPLQPVDASAARSSSDEVICGTTTVRTGRSHIASGIVAKSTSSRSADELTSATISCAVHVAPASISVVRPSEPPPYCSTVSSSSAALMRRATRWALNPPPVSSPTAAVKKAHPRSARYQRRDDHPVTACRSGTPRPRAITRIRTCDRPLLSATSVELERPSCMHEDERHRDTRPPSQRCSPDPLQAYLSTWLVPIDRPTTTGEGPESHNEGSVARRVDDANLTGP